MKRCASVLFIVITLAVSANGLSEKITKDTIVSEGKKHTYYLFVPENLKPTPAPLVVLLHGSNRNGLSLVEKWKDLAKKEGVIIAGPDSNDSSVWSIPIDGPGFLRDLVEALKGKYPVDARRVYLFGHSGGAIFALQMSLYESEYFAATAIHAGALGPEDGPLIDLAKRKTPVFIQVGTNDSFFPLKNVRATRDVLNARGFSVELTEIPRHDHWYYDLAPQINLAAWEFLKKQKLSDEPRFEAHQFRVDRPRTRQSTEQYNRGLERQRTGDLAGAIAAYTRSIEIDPDFSDAYNNRGVAHLGLKDLTSAVADFSRSIEIKPSESAYNNRGGAYFALGKTKEGIADFTEAIKLKPSAVTYYNRGAAYEQEGQSQLAFTDYGHAIELDSKLAPAYAFRGLNLLRRGDDAAAQRDLNKAFELEPKLRAQLEPVIKQIQAQRVAN